MTTDDGHGSPEDPREPDRPPASRQIPELSGASLVPDIQAYMQTYMKRLSESMVPTLDAYNRWIESFTPQIAPMIDALARLNLGTARGNLRGIPQNTAYSEEMQSPQDFYSPNQEVITNFDDLHGAIQRLIGRNPSLQLLWRGQRNAAWGLHSSLFRALMAVNRVRHPSEPHRQLEPYPTEEQMVAAERAILDIATDGWRLDGMNALEVFARIQHYGAPTRLLDVTRNPYVAAWFAVERAEEDDEEAGRLFALGTHPVLPPDQANLATAALTQIKGATAHGRTPFWHAFETNEDRQQLEWGTGAIRRFWIPPIYEQRILAQNGGFVVDGAPLPISGMAAYFKKPGTSSAYWRKADLLAASSIYTKVYSPSRRVAANSRRPFPPTFTFYITSGAKHDIRRVLEQRFAYTASTLYPDTEGLAQFLRSNFRDVVAASGHA